MANYEHLGEVVFLNVTKIYEHLGTQLSLYASLDMWHF